MITPENHPVNKHWERHHDFTTVKGDLASIKKRFVEAEYIKVVGPSTILFFYKIKFRM